MCFELDSSPPVPISGASVRHRRLQVHTSDANVFDAFEAFPDAEGDTAVVVLPDVRGLFPFYEQLAERLAEHGHHAVAIDYFGRTAGTGARPDEFDFMPHVRQTTYAGVRADVEAAVAHLRHDGDRRLFVLGFCFGGSNAWHMAAEGLGLAGVIGFYGHPDREFPAGSGSVIGKVDEMECPVLGLMGGDDPGIPLDLVDRYAAELTAAGVEHTIVVYPDAPHSFFDRNQEAYAAESADAWRRVLGFLESGSPEEL